MGTSAQRPIAKRPIMLDEDATLTGAVRLLATRSSKDVNAGHAAESYFGRLRDPRLVHRRNRCKCVEYSLPIAQPAQRMD